MRKKLIALLTLAAFLVSMVPTMAFAADDTDNHRVTVNVYGFTRDSETVSIFTKGGRSGDMYMVYLNDNIEKPIDSGLLRPNVAKEEVIQLVRAETPGFNDLRKGDVLHVRISSKGFGGIIGEAETTYISAVAIPETMDLLTESIEEGKKNQRVTVRFDEDYEPGSNDELRFVAYNKDGERLDRDKSESFAIKKKDLVERKDSLEMNTYITPDDDVAYYNVEFLAGDNIVAELTKKLNITPDYGDAKELVVKYPSDKIALGDSTKPEIYIITEKDKKVDVTEESTFNFVGDAVEKSDRKDGSFTIKKDEKYVGTKIVVTVVNGPFTQTKTFTVTDKNGNTEVKKDEPKEKPKKQKVTVIMGINSKDLLTNGVRSQLDAAPLIKNDRTFVPLRALLEAFGAEVKYDDKTRVITISLDDNVVVMTVGQKFYTVNGTPKTMDVEPYIMTGADRTMVPVRFVAESLGYKVEASANRDGTTANVVFSNF